MAMSRENHLEGQRRRWNVREARRLTEPLNIIALLEDFADAGNLFGSEYATYAIARCCCY